MLCGDRLRSARRRTALIQNRPVLGGNSSDELGVGICGASVSHPNARESGIMEEAGRVKAYFHHQRMSEGFRIVAEEEKQLRIFYNRHVIAATMRDPQRIAAVTAVDTLSGQLSEFRGKMFIDGTGDGWVGYYAGAKYRLGRESRKEFGEDLAPAQADKITMSGCIMGNYTVSFRQTRRAARRIRAAALGRQAAACRAVRPPHRSRRLGRLVAGTPRRHR